MQRTLYPLELLLSLILNQEQSRDQLMNRTGYEQSVARRNGLHARRYVRRFAIDVGAFAVALAHHDQPFVYTDSYRKGRMPLIPRPAVQSVNGLNDREPGKHRAMGI